MYIDPKIQARLSSAIQHAVMQLTDSEQKIFWMQFPSQSRDPVVMTLLAIFFPIQFFLISQIGLGVAFILTGYGCGIWWVVEWFLVAGRTRKYNDTIALNLIQGIRMNQSRQFTNAPIISAPPPPPLVVPGNTTTLASPLAAISAEDVTPADSLSRCACCQQDIRIPADLKGRAIRCPHCSALVN
jgi:hypothetical protein